jgi:NADP-dependent 3-hydroxy acid dehydrogenase YdfG
MGAPAKWPIEPAMQEIISGQSIVATAKKYGVKYFNVYCAAKANCKKFSQSAKTYTPLGRQDALN